MPEGKPGDGLIASNTAADLQQFIETRLRIIEFRTIHQVGQIHPFNLGAIGEAHSDNQGIGTIFDIQPLVERISQENQQLVIYSAVV